MAGGTSASKTVSILIYLISAAQQDKKPSLTSIVSESYPHLKRGAMRDFKMIMQEHNYWQEDRWNKTDSVYTFESGSKIEFFSVDQADKMRGARRDRLFMNEANNLTLDAFDQLEVRTKQVVFLDWNPTSEFWFYTDVLGNREDLEFITLTYKDNEALSQEIIDSIEARKGRKAWWRVYGEGQLGEVEGRIYTGWRMLDEVPHEARLEGRGLDFGYTNDPTAIVDVYYHNGGYILDEICYQHGLSNKQIGDQIKTQENDSLLVVADSAEPKSIDEIRGYGINIIGAKKGRDSVVHGIQLVQGLKISVTKRSLNLIKEYRNYMWMIDKDGKTLNKPEGGLDHALDAVRYLISSLTKDDDEPDVFEQRAIGIAHKQDIFGGMVVVPMNDKKADTSFL